MIVNTPLDILAQTARRAREARGMSQMDLAHKLNMNPHTIMDFEVGRSNPKAETVFLIADELGISLDAILFAGTDRPNAVNIEVLDFFAGKTPEEAGEYIKLCRQVEQMNKTNSED